MIIINIFYLPFPSRTVILIINNNPQPKGEQMILNIAMTLAALSLPNAQWDYSLATPANGCQNYQSMTVVQRVYNDMSDPYRALSSVNTSSYYGYRFVGCSVTNCLYDTHVVKCSFRR